MCDHCGCREFAPIAELTADHVGILELAWGVAEGEPDDPVAQEAMREELLAVLAAHALKEELGLYPLLISTGDLSRERCERLEDEHRSIPDIIGRGEFGRREYFALEAHIEEEEMELFSGARFAFDDDEWEAMAEAHHTALHRVDVDHLHDAHGDRAEVGGGPAATGTW